MIAPTRVKVGRAKGGPKGGLGKERSAMADKDRDKEDIGTRIASGLATMSAAYLAHKLLKFAWIKVTGKEPPTNPEDPRVALAEALSWAALVGTTIGAVRVLAIRAVSRKALGRADREPASAARD